MAYDVLLIDDDPNMEAIVKHVLPTDYNLSVAVSFSIGLEMLDKKEYHAVLLDLSLDNIAPRETLRLFFDEKNKAIAVIILSNHASKEMIGRAMDYGAAGYAVKDSHHLGALDTMLFCAIHNRQRLADFQDIISQANRYLVSQSWQPLSVRLQQMAAKVESFDKLIQTFKAMIGQIEAEGPDLASDLRKADEQMTVDFLDFQQILFPAPSKQRVTRIIKALQDDHDS